MGQFTRKSFEFMYKMALIIIAKQFSQPMPFYIYIGIQETNDRIKPDKPGKNFWMKPKLFKKMSFQCTFCCKCDFFKFPHRNTSFGSFYETKGFVHIPCLFFPCVQIL